MKRPGPPTRDDTQPTAGADGTRAARPENATGRPRTQRPAGLTHSSEPRTRTGRTTRPPVPELKPAARVNRRWYRRYVRSLMRAALVVLLIVGSVAGIAAFRLSQGPIPLTFLKSPIEHAVGKELGGNAIEIGSVSLALADGGLELHLADVALRDQAAGTLLHVPTAAIAIAPRALLAGRLAVERVELIKPRVNLDYATDGHLTLSITRGDAPAAAKEGKSATTTAGRAEVDLVKAVTSISAQARRQENATAYLRTIGLRDATIVVDNGRRKTIWHVPALDIDMRHKRSQSRVSGRAEIATFTGPIAIGFQALELASDGSLAIEATVTGANPRGLARQLPALVPFSPLDLPLDGKARMDLSGDGVLTAATLELDARPGHIHAGSLALPPMAVSTGGIVARFDRSTQAIEISRIFVAGEHGAIETRGVLQPVLENRNSVLEAWKFRIEGVGGHLGAAGPNALPIETLSLHGTLNADRGDVALETAKMRVAGIDVELKSLEPASGDPNPTVLEGRIGAAPLSRLLAAWPTDLQPTARQWLGKHLTGGRIAGGQIRMRAPPGASAQTFELALETQAIEIAPTERLPRLSLPTALLQIADGTLEITAPDVLVGDGTRRLNLKSAKFSSPAAPEGTQRTGTLAIRLLGPLLPLVELADREPDRLVRSAGLNPAGIDGKIDGLLRLSFPLAGDIAATEITTEGRIRITDARVKNIFANHDVSGGKFDIEISDKAIDVNGDLLFAGINVRVQAQHHPNQPPERQPPVRLTGTIDNADRNTLGLDINDIVWGEVPLDIAVTRDAKGEAQIRVTADLTRSEVSLDSLAWRKPPGKPGAFVFEPQRQPNGRIDLNNVKLSGDTVAAEGSIVIGPDNKPKEFSFKEFTLNTISRLEVHGTMKSGNVWDVKARGIRFDARDLFRDMFNIGTQTQKVLPKNKPGLDLTAEIDHVLGFNDSNLRNVRILMQRRVEGTNEKMTSLDVAASHDNGKPFQAQIRNQPGTGRRLAATSEDAGLTFKTVGFYPNAAGGRLGLEVMLDGKAGVERSGNLVATGFAILGDPVVSEVFQNTEQPSHGRSEKKKVVRQQFDFDWMRIPFLVGSGQFVMNDAQIKGPIVGASWRGKVDFRAQAMQVSGTYVPLQGLNSAVSGIPILGQLLTGPKGEGIFGVTFSVVGPTTSPEVIVNPLSMMAPGVFREIFQLGPDQYKINPQLNQQQSPRTDASRASSAPPAASGSPNAAPQVPRSRSQTISDWSSETKPAPARSPRVTVPQSAQ